MGLSLSPISDKMIADGWPHYQGRDGKEVPQQKFTPESMPSVAIPKPESRDHCGRGFQITWDRINSPNFIPTEANLPNRIKWQHSPVK